MCAWSLLALLQRALDCHLVWKVGALLLLNKQSTLYILLCLVTAQTRQTVYPPEGLCGFDCCWRCWRVLWAPSHPGWKVSAIQIPFIIAISIWIYVCIHCVLTQQTSKNAVSLLRWKVHESCMLAMGSVQQMIVEALQLGKVQFNLPGFLQSVVLEDMNLSGERAQGKELWGVCVSATGSCGSARLFLTWLWRRRWWKSWSCF